MKSLPSSKMAEARSSDGAPAATAVGVVAPDPDALVSLTLIFGTARDADDFLDAAPAFFVAALRALAGWSSSSETLYSPPSSMSTASSSVSKSDPPDS